MADNFLQAINTGINLGHMADSVKMQRAQMEKMAAEMTLRQNAQMLELAKYNEGMQQRRTLQSNFAAPTTKPGGDEYTGPMDEIVMGPGRESLRGQYGDMGDLASNLILGGVSPKEASAFLPKQQNQTRDQFKVVGGNLIDTTKDPTKPVFTAPEKPVAGKEPAIPLFVDKPLADGTTQKMRWNPKTQDHDLPFGSPQAPHQSAMATKPQQSMFTDPESGLPLVFDPATGNYKVAEVGGSGKVAPRTVNPSAGERTTNAMFDVLRGQLKRIQDSYNSKYVGLISGQLGRVTQWADSDEAAFRQVILDVKDSLLRARSGAQINEQEYKRLSKFVPDMTDSEPQFMGKMTSFEATLNSIATEREKAQRKGGVYIRQPQGAATTAPGGPEIGSVVDGFRFMGGNPADQKSWKKVGE